MSQAIQAAAVYTLTGHGEAALASASSGCHWMKSGMNVTELNLLTQGAIPQDCSLLIMNAPARDISADEKEMLTDYLKNGGRMLPPCGLYPGYPGQSDRFHFPVRNGPEKWICG